MTMNTEYSTLAVSDNHAFTPEQQKIVQALSDNDYQWRTIERLSAVTGLQEAALSAALTQLLREDIVKPSFSKKHNIIYGLRSRVEKK